MPDSFLLNASMHGMRLHTTHDGAKVLSRTQGLDVALEFILFVVTSHVHGRDQSHAPESHQKATITMDDGTNR